MLFRCVSSAVQTPSIIASTVLCSVVSGVRSSCATSAVSVITSYSIHYTKLYEAINSPESIAAIEYYRDVLGAHAPSSWTIDTGVEVMEHFLKQEVAFEIQGIWGVTDVLKNGSPFEVDVIPLKQIGICSEIGPMMLVIPKNMSDETKSQATDFIRYMISMDAQEAIRITSYNVCYTKLLRNVFFYL